MDEVAALATVFEDLRSASGGESAAEDARDTGVRRVAGHSWPIHVVVPEHRRRHAVFPSERGHEVFLVDLRRGIDVPRIERGIFAHDHGLELVTATGAPRFEPARVEVAAPSGTGTDRPVVSTPVCAFAVDDHAAGQYEPSGEIDLVHGPQTGGSANVVGMDVAADVREVDSETDLGGLVTYGVGAVDCIEPGTGIGHVRPPIVDPLAERGGRAGVCGRIQRVEHYDVVTGGYELLDDVGTDEAGASGDDYAHRVTTARRWSPGARS
jgi:hypothetical protein